MFEVRLSDAPKGCANCASCGCYGNGLRVIRTYQCSIIKGKRVKNKAQMSEINLCRDCRRKLMFLLWELDDEDDGVDQGK